MIRPAAAAPPTRTRCGRTGRAACSTPAVIAVLLLAVVPPAPASDVSDPAELEAALDEGLHAYEDAMAALRNNPRRAEQAFRTAAERFERVAADGVRSAALEYNLGNVHFRLGQLGRAVLHYRRGLELDPGDADLRANLALARNRVEPYIAPAGSTQLTQRLLFWTQNTSLDQRFWLLCIASVAGWLALAFWVVWRTPALLVVSGLLITFAVLNAGSTVWQLRDRHARPPAVVLQEQVLRIGRGEGYDAALTQPLGPGVEVRVLEERAGWAEVRLGSGVVGWLPLDAVERV